MSALLDGKQKLTLFLLLGEITGLNKYTLERKENYQKQK